VTAQRIGIAADPRAFQPFLPIGSGIYVEVGRNQVRHSSITPRRPQTASSTSVAA
jgi:hypothetical protein